MHGKLERNAASIANSVSDALGEIEMMPIAGHEIAAGLRDADNRSTGLDFSSGKAEIEKPLEVESGHLRIIRVIPPRLAPKHSVGLDRHHQSFLVAWTLVRAGSAVVYARGRLCCNPVPKRLARRLGRLLAKRFTEFVLFAL